MTDILVDILAAGGQPVDLSSNKAVVTNTNVTIDSLITFLGKPTLKFGTGSKLTIPDPHGYLTFLDSDFTIDCYFYPTEFRNQPADNSNLWPIFAWGSWHSTGKPYNLEMYYGHNTAGYSHYWNFVFNELSTNNAILNPTNGQVFLNQWNHIAYQVKNKTYQWFKNGVPLITPQSDIRQYNYTYATSLVIGQMYGGGTGNIVWQAVGNIGRFRIRSGAQYPSIGFNPY